MGCNHSCVPTGEGNAFNVTSKVTWYYFEGNGRGDPLMQMFEYHRQPHEKISLDFAEWDAKKAAGGAGEFGGGLP